VRRKACAGAVVAEQRHQPAHRARERVSSPGGAHALRKRQPQGERAEQRRQHLERRLAGVVDGDRHVLALGRLDPAHLGGIHALALAEADQRPGGRTVGTESHLDRGAGRLLVEVGLALGQVLDE
jgi:hypothetical protein